jgi:large subunit ribosomal protein L7/L12
MATNPKLFEIADTLSKLTVLEAKELLNILENDYGIKPEDTGIIMPTPIIETKEIEQTEFNVYLKEVGGQKLQIIKKVKELLNSELKASKELVDSAPCILCEKTSKANANTFKSELENLGAIIEIR